MNYRWANSRTVFNAYGPTETTVGAAFSLVYPGVLNPTISTPLPQVELYILTSQLHPTPVGVIGELYIGGPGVARGYLNQPELTKQRFIPNPFPSSNAPTLYKTSDLFKRWNDGRLEFVGRADEQIKLHGYRIELTEVEEVLKKHETIVQAAVALKEQGKTNSKLLVGYVTLKDKTVKPAEILEWMRSRLPAFKVPSLIVILDRLPIFPNGKINKRILPDPVAKYPYLF